MNTKPLSYWKARSVQLRDAIAEWQQLKRFADHKIEQLEQVKLSAIRR